MTVIAFLDADQRPILSFDADIVPGEWQKVTSPPFGEDCTVSYIQCGDYKPISPDLIPPFDMKQGQTIAMTMRGEIPTMIEPNPAPMAKDPAHLDLCSRYFKKQ